MKTRVMILIAVLILGGCDIHESGYDARDNAGTAEAEEILPAQIEATNEAVVVGMDVWKGIFKAETSMGAVLECDLPEDEMLKMDELVILLMVFEEDEEGEFCMVDVFYDGKVSGEEG